VDGEAHAVFAETGVKIDYSVGTMIELPRAAMLADQIAELADFFSFGTNDLTQTVFGLSRDDAGTFPAALRRARDPAEGPVRFHRHRRRGRDDAHRFEEGRATKNNLKLGICGEHGGDPARSRSARRSGWIYVSCSPYRVPVARLAAAQAALGATGDRTT